MKTRIHNSLKVFFTLMMLTGTTAFAARPNTSKEERKIEREISTEIKTQILFPDFLLIQTNSEFFAEVAFKVKEGGKINILTIDTNDEQLKREVENQLSKMRLNLDEINTAATYRVVLRFRML